MMRKTNAVICMVLAMVLVCSSMSLAIAEGYFGTGTLMDHPTYNNSFLLWVESETKQEFTPEDFPEVEDLYYVNIAKMTPTENGYQYLLFMAIDTWDLDKAKLQAGQYGEVMINCLASDYANATSKAYLNHSSVEMKVGETIDLSVVEYSLTRWRYGLEGVMFTVDPQMMDEAVLVESGYQDLGIDSIYGDQEEPVLTPMYEVVGVIRESYDTKTNQVSPLHSYYAVPHIGTEVTELSNTLANVPGVEKVELVYEPLAVLAVMPSASYHCSPNGIVDVKSMGLWDCTLTALEPGETVVTAKVSGGGYGSTSVSCKVTVVENTPQSPTDIPTETPTDIPETPTDVMGKDLGNDVTEIYTGTSYIYKYTAVSALHILRAAVGKEEGSINRKYDVNADGEINAVDALWALQTAVGKRVVEWPLDKAFPE